MLNIGYIDRDGNKAQVTQWMPYAASIDDTLAYADNFISNTNAISDALVYRMEMVWKYTIDVLPMPSVTSDISRGLLILIENDSGELSGIRIPSPKAELFETTGKYAYIRMDKTNSAVIDFQTLLNTQDFRTADNRQLGHTIINGGLML